MIDFWTLAIGAIISLGLALAAGFLIGWAQPFPHKHKKRILLVFGLAIASGLLGSLWAKITNADANFSLSWGGYAVLSVIAVLYATEKAPAIQKYCKTFNWRGHSDT